MAEYNNLERNVYPKGADTKNPTATKGSEEISFYEWLDESLYKRTVIVPISIIQGRIFRDAGVLFDTTARCKPIELIYSKPKPDTRVRAGRRTKAEVEEEARKTAALNSGGSRL